jgi:hypothetical protein
MVTVIKFNILELDGPLQILGLVTTLAGTGGIGDFRPRFGFLVGQRNVLGKLVQAIEFALDFPRQPRFKVTVRAADVRVRGNLPALIEWLHVVAGVAELGSRSKFGCPIEKEGHNYNNGNNDGQTFADSGTHFRMYITSRV